MLKTFKISLIVGISILVMTTFGLISAWQTGDLSQNPGASFYLILPLVIIFASSYNYRLLRKVERLKTHGLKIEANVIEVNKVQSMLMDKYQVIAGWNDPQNGKEYIFKSMKFPLASGYIIDQEGRVDVYVDPNNYNYFFLEPKRIIH